MNELLLAIGLVLVFIIILFILIFISSKRTNFIIQNLFIDKMSEYDFLIENKDKQLVDLDEKISGLKNEISIFEDEISNLAEKKELLIDNNTFDYDNIEKKADFLDNDSLDNYKKIKKYFNKSKEDIIKKFLVNSVKDSDSNYYNNLVNIKSYFTKNVIYQLICYSNDIQLEIIKDLLSDDEKNCINDLLNVRKFDIYKFISSIDKYIIENDNKIIIYVGSNENFDYLNKNIKTVFDDNITEGLKIEYKGTIYDYSI